MTPHDLAQAREQRRLPARPDEWHWIDLMPGDIAYAQEYAKAMLFWTKGKQGRYAHTPDEWVQKFAGGLGEVGFSILEGYPFPAIPSGPPPKVKIPDIGPHEIKTTQRLYGGLLFDDRDLAATGLEDLVLMYASAQAPERVALIGGVLPEEARRLRARATDLPRPCWKVWQYQLQPWERVAIPW